MSTTTDAPATVDEMAQLMARLAELYEATTAAIEARRRDVLACLTAETATAGRVYEARLHRFDRGALDPAARLRLAPLAGRLKRAAALHESRLRVAVAAQKRLIACVRDAVSEIAAGPGIYSRYGTVGPAKQSAVLPPAVAFNRAI